MLLKIGFGREGAGDELLLNERNIPDSNRVGVLSLQWVIHVAFALEDCMRRDSTLIS